MILTDEQLEHVCGGYYNPYRVYNTGDILASILTLGIHAAHRERQAVEYDRGLFGESNQFPHDYSINIAYNRGVEARAHLSRLTGLPKRS